MSVVAAPYSMNTIKIKDEDLRKAAGDGMDAFLQVFNDAIMSGAGGELTAESMELLTTEQLTLTAYLILRDEVMDGGFVQLIHNGYGGFFFRNPFSKMMRLWGLDELAMLMNKAKKLYCKHHEEIENDCTDEEFMALFERFPAFDSFDDTFVENEERWTELVASYVDEHIELFAEIEKQ